MSSGDAATRARLAPLLVWLAILAVAAAALATGSGLRTDMTAFMPRSKNADEALLVSLLEEGPAARTVLMAIDAGNDDTGRLPALARRFATGLRETGDFSRIASGDAPDLEALDKLFEYRYLLAPGHDDGRDAFSEAALRKALEARLDELRSSLGVFDKAVLAADPTAAFTRLLLALRPASEPSRSDGVWLSTDGRRALLVAETVSRGYNLDAQTRAISGAREIFASLGDNDARLLMAGPPAFAVAASSAIRVEATVLAVGASIVLVGFLFMVYGSARMVLLGAVPVATGMLIGAAAVNLVYDGLHGITLAFGMTLLGVTLDYPLHLFSHATGRATLSATAKAIWPTLRLGALTSVLAFASLGLSRFDGMAELALFAACGLVGASLCTRYVLPVLFPDSWRNTRALPKLFASDRARTTRGAKLQLIVAIALAGAGGVFAVQIARAPAERLWENNLAALSPVPAASISLDRELRAALGAPDVSHAIVLRATDLDAALGSSEAIRPILQRLVEDGAITGFDLPSRYLPSARTQRERGAALPDERTLSGRLQLALEGLPFKTDAFEPFIRDIARAHELEPLTLRDIADTPLAARIGPMLLADDKRGVVALVNLSGVTDPDRVARAVDEWRRNTSTDASVLYIDLKQTSDRVVTSYRTDALRLLGWSLPVLAIVLWFGTRSLRRLGACALAIALAVIVDLGLLAATGTRLSVFHLIAVVLVAGIGLDYGLFFSRPGEDRATRARTLHAVCVCALSTVMVFGLLATSSLPVLRAIGATVALGVALAFASTLLLTRGASFGPRPDRVR